MFQKLILSFLFFVLMQQVISQERDYIKDTVKRNNFIAIGETYLRVQDYEKSIEYFNKALEYDSTSNHANYNLAISY